MMLLLNYFMGCFAGLRVTSLQVRGYIFRLS